MCDCGDPSSWKTNPYCKKHEPKENNNNEILLKSSISNPGVPEDLSNRIRRLMRIVVDFIFEAFAYQENADTNGEDYFMGEK